MLFNSAEFLIFFPLVTLLYFFTKAKYRWLLLLAASYYFYASWKFEYVFLIAFSTLIDYFCGLQMGKLEQQKEKLPYLVLSLVTNLGFLFAFKYFDFFSSIFNGPKINLLLPVGISFYTFQTLSYSFDVFRGRKKPETHLGYFALYVCFFPQLVAGPIERATRLIPQFKREHQFCFERARDGLVMMLWGFFRKIVIADNLAMFVDYVFEQHENLGGLSTLLAGYMFGFQVYLDFAAYSEIAIGAAMVLGFKLMTNFRRPYIATSLSELWQRWHISLVSWFRDYIYVPFTSSKDSAFKRAFNMILIFFLSGLWHGANWTFILWGTLHGVFLVIENLSRDWRRKFYETFVKSERLKHFIKNFITVFIFSVLAIFFRAQSLDQAFAMIATVFDFSSYQFDVIASEQKLVIFCLALIVLVKAFEYFEEQYSFQTMLIKSPIYLRWFSYIFLIVSSIAFIPKDAQQFIYFQF